MDGERGRQASPTLLASPEQKASPDTDVFAPPPPDNRPAAGHLARTYASDVAIAGVVAALLVGGTLLPGAPNGPAQVGVLGYLLLLSGSAALVVRRTAPVAALVVSTACMLAYALGVSPETTTTFPVLVTVFSAANAGRRAWASSASAVYLAGVLLVEMSDLGTRTPREVVDRLGLQLGWFVAANVAGVVSRQRQAYLRQAEQRAIEAERTREEAALRRAGEERLRIARELHDSLTHSISIIKVQAGVAVHLARKRGEEVPPALLAIQDASADAMRELRATLEVLREPGADDAPGTARADRIGELVERARSAGVPATLAVTGTPRALPPEVDLAAYRIVQEALTNVARHAGPASASVHVGYRPDSLVVRVEDDGRGQPGGPACAERPEAARTGVGLTGMRERVSALGGRLQTGPGPHGGFVVHAELPLTGVICESHVKEGAA
ncbi:two-component sensor histidine kinase [Microbispora rosea subsp. aerata]|nr:sensor histidine kinase [Microbispora rosea]GGO14822.1 two-component sensor histidine kinase [Microbispora rosea subsp. aerata]GIH55604.1 two-component sensor histidine kinase [Microbispora rosea subsp. aerata]GLJ86554.1 two-component sensor histidine kinase [Microbispora rosea subsp. aerata]